MEAMKQKQKLIKITKIVLLEPRRAYLYST